MPGSMREVDHAEEEGVEFVWQAAPEAFLGDGVRKRREGGAHSPRARPMPPAASAPRRSRTAASPWTPTS